MTDSLEKAKIRRAKELVLEAADMDPSDAAIMFLLAAHFAQYNSVVSAVKKGLAGEPIGKKTAEDDFFKTITSMPGIQDRIAEFQKSRDFREFSTKATLESIKKTSSRVGVAFVLLVEAEAHGIDVTTKEG